MAAGWVAGAGAASADQGVADCAPEAPAAGPVAAWWPRQAADMAEQAPGAIRAELAWRVWLQQAAVLARAGFSVTCLAAGQSVEELVAHAAAPCSACPLSCLCCLLRVFSPPACRIATFASQAIEAARKQPPSKHHTACAATSSRPSCMALLSARGSALVQQCRVVAGVRRGVRPVPGAGPTVCAARAPRSRLCAAMVSTAGGDESGWRTAAGPERPQSRSRLFSRRAAPRAARSTSQLCQRQCQAMPT